MKTDLHPIERRVNSFIASEKMFSDAETVIVGLSGGADSVALVTILNRIGYNCIAAHCNFHLRGEESNRDETFVKEYAERYCIPLETVSFNVKEYIDSQPHPMSVEMACRELRYDWFNSLKDRFGNMAVVAVAHNADDNIETLMLNLVRRTGIAGMRGMLPVNAKGIVRPLLCIYRSEIEGYLSDMGISFITDSTNSQNIYQRNKLRNVILPELYRCFPGARQQISGSIANLMEAWKLLNDTVERERKKFFVSPDVVDLTGLMNESIAPSLLLYEWLSPLGVSRSQIIDIVADASQTGRTFPTRSGTTLLIDHGKLLIIRNEKEYNGLVSKDSNDDNLSPTIESVFNITLVEGNEIIPDRTGMTVFFDADQLPVDFLKVRYWRKGDRIKPFGMNGSKLLSDIFTDAGVPRHLRLSIPLLTGPFGEILYVGGLRASRLYAVTSSTRHHWVISPKHPSSFISKNL